VFLPHSLKPRGSLTNGSGRSVAHDDVGLTVEQWNLLRPLSQPSPRRRDGRGQSLRAPRGPASVDQDLREGGSSIGPIGTINVSFSTVKEEALRRADRAREGLDSHGGDAGGRSNGSSRGATTSARLAARCEYHDDTLVPWIFDC
jgi:hypothetical protein